MHLTKLLLSGVAAAGLFAATAAHAGTAVVNFDNLPLGPSYYLAASPSPQTIVVPNVATFTGGVILGDASAFPAIAYATAPNVYGTAYFGFGLANLLDIAISPAYAVNEVSFVLFNGLGSTLPYEVDAYSGTTLVASQDAYVDVSGDHNI